MAMLWKWTTMTLLLLSLTILSGSQANGELQGHLRPFGEQGPVKQIEERTSFMGAKEFFDDYVAPLKPVKFAGLLKDAPCVRDWTDQYLLLLDVPEDSIIHLETLKKEDRNQETEDMHFHKFLKIYNDTEYYMVDETPPYLQ
jgi:hypothetical protein